jgi:F5/8 type C domain
MKQIAVFAAAWAVVALLPGGLAQTPNLALNKSVTRSSDVSSGRAPNAVDGDVATFWQPLMSDRTDDLNVWLRVDLGAPVAIDRAVLNLRTSPSRVDGFFLQASQDGTTWQEMYRSVGAIASIETALFASVTARFIRVDFTPTPAARRTFN